MKYRGLRVFLILSLLPLSIGCNPTAKIGHTESGSTETHSEEHFSFRDAETNEVWHPPLSDGINEKPSYLFGSPSYKWPDGVINWRYNPSGQPSVFSTTEAVNRLIEATKRWEAVCGVKFQYQGTTSAAVRTSGCDKATVVGWGPLSGSTVGYTQVCYSSGKNLAEFDLKLDNLAPLQIRDSQRLMMYAAHEFGHALGLGHSDSRAAVMYPTITADILHDDDVLGCRQIYGMPAAPAPAPAPTPAPAPAPTPAPAPAAPACSSSMSAVECEMFTKVNTLRQSRGLAAFTASSNCIAEAQFHAREMAATGFFSYDSPNETFRSRMTRFGLAGSYYGENIAWGYSADQTIQVWMGSSGNRGKLLSTNYRSAGVGYAVSASGRRYWVQCYSGLR